MTEPNWTQPAQAADVMAGNYRTAPYLSGSGDPDFRNQPWAAYGLYGHDPDSLTMSNAMALCEALSEVDQGETPYQGFSYALLTPTGAPNHGKHWRWTEYGGAFGHGANLWVLTRTADGQLTPAWLRFCEEMMKLEDYPVLDEDAWSQLEDEECWAMAEQAAPTDARDHWRTRWAQAAMTRHYDGGWSDDGTVPGRFAYGHVAR